MMKPIVTRPEQPPVTEAHDPPRPTESYLNQRSDSSTSFPSTTSEYPVRSEHAPTDYESISYYNGIAGKNDHPRLLYRSDMKTRPYPVPSPKEKFSSLPIKEARGVYNTPLNRAWDDVGPGIRNLIKAQDIHYTSISVVRFVTRYSVGGDEQDVRGPPVIWIGVSPGSTSADMAHDASQEILALLAEHGVEDVTVEWTESVVSRL